MKTDIQIAQEAELLPIREVAEKLDITEDELELYGKYKAKLSDEYMERISKNPDGKLILVTAINPTPAGEGNDKCRSWTGLWQTGKESGDRIKRAFPWTVLWDQRRCGRRRPVTGGAYGGSESSLHR